ncbi:GntR family transcriptional regulator [Paenarthrobacter sp. NPDC058040]|uniref:GntR family transcriptional regulator n=1 Tax=unclassified Paenarthrobacter TaxID=2634190 RepID=UPI0036DECCFE
MSELTAAAGDLSSTRTVQAYEDLRNLIISGHFKPNVRLTDAELTGLLDVSRGTVRAVTARLVSEGYLTSEPHRGVRTRIFSVEEAVEILEAREILESALAGKAAERATDDELEDLAATCEQMASAEYDRQEAEYSRLNRHFHKVVRDAARQPTLSGFTDQLLYALVMRQYRSLTRKHPRRDALNEHRAILYALQTRNAEAASAAMRHHVASARRALLAAAASDTEGLKVVEDETDSEVSA